MADKGWVQVAAAPETTKRAEELAEKLASPSIKLNKARVLRAALVIGLEELERDPSRMLSRT